MKRLDGIDILVGKRLDHLDGPWWMYACDLIRYLSRLLARSTCRHRFDYVDLVHRDANSNVKWACWKCGKLFVAPCGLDILSHGEVQRKEQL